MLKPRTKDFLKELLVHILINSQLSTPFITSNTENITLTRQRGTIEELFIKATRADTVAMGLVYFMTEAFRDTLVQEDNLSRFLVWAVALAKETLQTGLDVIPGL
jgi:nucleolar MIF4G domain-containing protein 1